MQIAYRPRAEEALSSPKLCGFVADAALLFHKTKDLRHKLERVIYGIAYTPHAPHAPHALSNEYFVSFFFSPLSVWNRVQTTQWLAKLQLWPPPLQPHPQYCHPYAVLKDASRPQLPCRELPLVVVLPRSRNWVQSPPSRISQDPPHSPRSYRRELALQDLRSSPRMFVIAAAVLLSVISCNMKWWVIYDKK